MKRLPRWDWIALALVGVAVFAIHFLFLGRDGPDDAWFLRALDGRTLTEFLVQRYRGWSSRIPLEAMLVFLIHHETVWRILNSLMVLLLCYGVGRLALRRGATAPAATSIAFAVLMLMPAHVMQVVWWVTGSLNYLWPAAFGLYGSIRLVERTRRRPIENGLMVLASGLAVYHEQIAVILLPIQLALVVDRFRTGHRDRWDAIQMAWVAANVCVVLSAPGFYPRFLQEQLWWFPHFATLSPLERVNLGVGLVVRSVFDRDNLMVLLLAAGCIRLLLRRALTPLMLLLLAGSTVFVAWAVLVRIDDADARFIVDAVLAGLPGETASSPLRHLAQALAVCAIGILSAASVVALAPNGAGALRLSGLLASAFLSIAVIGFSPTVHASGGRVRFVGMVVLALVTCRVLYANMDAGTSRTSAGAKVPASA